MHEPFEPKCTFCARFVRCFPDSSPMSEWGYCAEGRGGTGPSLRSLAGLEEEARRGNYGRLLEIAAVLGVFQETEDGCERFVPATSSSTEPPSGPGSD